MSAELFFNLISGAIRELNPEKAQKALREIGGPKELKRARENLLKLLEHVAIADQDLIVARSAHHHFLSFLLEARKNSRERALGNSLGSYRDGEHGASLSNEDAANDIFEIVKTALKGLSPLALADEKIRGLIALVGLSDIELSSLFYLVLNEEGQAFFRSHFANRLSISFLLKEAISAPSAVSPISSPEITPTTSPSASRKSVLAKLAGIFSSNSSAGKEVGSPDGVSSVGRSLSMTDESLEKFAPVTEAIKSIFSSRDLLPQEIEALKIFPKDQLNLLLRSLPELIHELFRSQGVIIANSCRFLRFESTVHGTGTSMVTDVVGTRPDEGMSSSLFFSVLQKPNSGAGAGSPDFLGDAAEAESPDLLDLGASAETHSSLSSSYGFYYRTLPSCSPSGVEKRGFTPLPSGMGSGGFVFHSSALRMPSLTPGLFQCTLPQ